MKQFIWAIQKLNETATLSEFFSHLGEESAGSSQEFGLQICEAIQRNAHNFVLTQEHIDGDSLTQHIPINRLSLSISFNLFKDSVSDLGQHSAKNDAFKLGKSLVGQTGYWSQINVKSVEILEKALHPSDHNLMISPS